MTTLVRDMEEDPEEDTWGAERAEGTRRTMKRPKQMLRVDRDGIRSKSHFISSP
jgi:hypothetical protein